MEKSFENRKVSFFILDRKNVEKTKIHIHDEREYDEWDIQNEFMHKLAKRASNDYGFMDRKKPKFLSKMEIMNYTKMRRPHTLSSVISAVRQEVLKLDYPNATKAEKNSEPEIIAREKIDTPVVRKNKHRIVKK